MLRSKARIWLDQQFSANNIDFIKCVFVSRRYSRHSRQSTNNKMDSRKNVRYPYVQGDPIQEEVIKDLNTSNSALSRLKKTNKAADNNKMEYMKSQQHVFETAPGVKFEKLQEGDIRLGRTILAAKSSLSKGTGDTILLEGHRLIRDALFLGAKAKNLYFCDPAVLTGLPRHLLKDICLYKISHKDMKVWSDTITPAGILGIFQKPEQGKALTSPGTILPITVIFDNLKDPGNAGTLIRTAAAVGCQRIITTKGTVNVWDCKVLRSGMGGHFSVPIYSGILWRDIPNYLEDNTHVFLANTFQSSMESIDEKLQSEGLDRDDESDITDSDDKSNSDLQCQENLTRQLWDEQGAQAFQNIQLPVCEYSKIKLSYNGSSSRHRCGKVNVALVLGGETVGLSAQAKRFAYNNYGSYLSIPMNTTVNSLNTSIAGSILLYELRRNLLSLEPSINNESDFSR